MLHACVERFDVTGIVGKILGTKRGFFLIEMMMQRSMSRPPGQVAGTHFGLWIEHIQFARTCKKLTAPCRPPPARPSPPFLVAPHCSDHQVVHSGWVEGSGLQASHWGGPHHPIRSEVGQRLYILLIITVSS